MMLCHNQQKVDKTVGGTGRGPLFYQTSPLHAASVTVHCENFSISFSGYLIRSLQPNVVISCEVQNVLLKCFMVRLVIPGILSKGIS